MAESYILNGTYSNMPGALLSATINFVILAFVAFMIATSILKEEKITKK